jgi:hypothetical protein
LSISDPQIVLVIFKEISEHLFRHFARKCGHSTTQAIDIGGRIRLIGL